jgi:hypothetical protein
MNAIEINKRLKEIFGDKYEQEEDISEDMANEVENNEISEEDDDRIKMEPLDDSQLRQLCGDDMKIVLNGDLHKYNDILELLPKDVDAFILLYGPSDDGHWCLVSRQGDILEYFNSYGGHYGGIDMCCEWYNKMPEHELKGGGTPYLSQLLEKDKDKYEILYNQYPFQDMKHRNISTCGRWCTLRWKAIQDGIGLGEFIKIIKDVAKMTGLNNDQIVSDLVPLEH